MNTSPERMLIRGKRYSIVSSLKALEMARSQSYQPRIELTRPCRTPRMGATHDRATLDVGIDTRYPACSPGLGRSPVDLQPVHREEGVAGPQLVEGGRIVVDADELLGAGGEKLPLVGLRLLKLL